MTDSNKWYTQSGPDGDVVLSTRIRLARNFSDIPFGRRMTDAQKAQVEERVRDAVLNGNSTLAGSFHYIDMEHWPSRAGGILSRTAPDQPGVFTRSGRHGAAVVGG